VSPPASTIQTQASAPRVLLVYFTYTQQTRRVADTIADVLRVRGCEVRLAAIELTDGRYAKPFTRFPLPHPYWNVARMLPARIRRTTGRIQIPDEALVGVYDLVVIGSPTWWLGPSLPIRSYMTSEAAGRVLVNTRFAAFVVCRRYWGSNLRTVQKLGAARGGQYVDGMHFSFAGGQIRSLLSLISYLGTGENRERYLGVRIPPSNLQPDHAQQARVFATGLADRLLGESGSRRPQLRSVPTGPRVPSG
jgi:hypothetical protein